MLANVNEPAGSKEKLLQQFYRPQVVPRSETEIDEMRKDYFSVVASCALEDAEPDEFGKAVAMEHVRGELTTNQARLILQGLDPEETKRIELKIQKMHSLGLSWADL